MTIEERLNRLEGELARARWFNRVGLFTAVAFATGLSWVAPLSSQDGKESKPIRAARFEVVDDKGRLRGVFGMQGDAPTLTLSDEILRTRCALNGGKDGSGLTLTGEDNTGRLHLAAGKLGSAVSLEDTNQKSRLEIAVIRDAAEVWLSDANQNSRATIKVGKEGPLMRLIQDKTIIWSTEK